ncbi:MAG TPA: Hsp20/alpha crystallin family protein [Candidatus Omnitrophota bacterium]|jgi:HSP20 family protein|nr:Hsp20/alpha crystallin family protein [Candidatus Omnitrophota bacterium]HPN55973.1 Hsp20/alpha crystallin family protein [Candidatus Omnitrophota bacterium]
MSLIKWKRAESDMWNDVFDLQHPFLGLSLLPLIGEGGGPRVFFPAFDVTDNKEQFVVKADVPGLKKEDIQIHLDRNILTVRGERRQEPDKEDGGYRRIERSSGAFERSVVFDSKIDAAGATAKYQDGVLEIVLPRTKGSEAQRIEIK